MKLEVRNLHKAFDGHVVLDGINLAFEGVQCLALIGPSGGGKSTLLRILGGLEHPEAGEVAINGKGIDFHEKALRQHRRTVGTVFQNFNLFPHLTALENITLPLEKVHGYTRDDARDVAIKLLQRFHLESSAQKRPAEMSGGQRQRAAIVRALAVKPQVVLLDEPTSALDPEMTAEVLDAIEEVKAEGRDLVVVTHQMGFARRVADRVALLAGGQIAECGSPEQIFQSPQTEACRSFLSRVLKY